MLSEKQISEIKEHLEKAQNPIFYYDNDADGLCSYVLLRKFLDRGKGVCVRSFPGVDGQYVRKASELGADYIFILDKPVVSREFVEEIDGMGLPIVWIDHHNVEGEPDFSKEFKNFFEYDSSKSSKNGDGEPVTYLVYQITGKKEDSWLAMAGCVADHFLPDFVDEFKERWPDYWGNVDKPFDAYFGTEIGKIAEALNFGLKTSTSNIVKLQNFLISCKEPGDVFEESGKNYDFRMKYKEIEKKYSALLEKAKENIEGNLLFFEYGGDLSISSELSNKLCYLYPDKYIVISFNKGNVSNLSLRGENVKDILLKILKGFDDAIGGGHRNAVGAKIRTDDLGKFKDLFKEEIK